MADQLKDFYDERVVRSIAQDLARVHPSLDENTFVREGLKGLGPLSLTQRGAHLMEVMRRHLPADYEAAVRVIVASLGTPHPTTESFGMEPFRYLPHTLFVSRYGLDHFEVSMNALHELTKRFTAEGAIRAFLIRHPKETYARLVEWAAHPDVHVRRLVSEGTRPRLPWAERLRDFQKDPRPVLALLERLKDDPERYVQRSVANNLNDIAKDHPDAVVQVCRSWLAGATPARKWIVHHALRSLVKRGHPGALRLLGVGAAPRVRVGRATFDPRRVRLGNTLRFSFEVTSTAARSQDLLVDYAVHFVKADGQPRPKVFKLKRLTLAGGERVRLESRVSLAVLTTRKPYRGRHRVDALLNGVVFPLGAFDAV